VPVVVVEKKRLGLEPEAGWSEIHLIPVIGGSSMPRIALSVVVV
jgi:hypothetical protein